MKINEGKLLLLFSGILAGIFIAVSIVNTSLNPTKFLSYQDYEQMSLDANKLKIELKSLNKQASAQSKKLNAYENSGDKDKTISDTMKKELQELQTFYGASTVEGPGVLVSIDDRHAKYVNDDDLMFSITHDEDILYVVNDLKNAGAEAVSVNGKRIIATSAITCEGPVIMINGQYIVPPFIIKAIGDPEALNYALTTAADSRYRDLELRKHKVSIKKVKKLVIDGISVINNPKYENNVQ